MLRKELKIAAIAMGTFCFPLFAQTTESANGPQGQAPASYVPGEKIKTGQLPGAYNQSATYACDYGWDIYITGDYLYWKWQQDSFQLGTVVKGGTDELDPFRGESHSVFQNPGYKSGFQVGVGFNMPGMDNWHLYSEYTWYRNTDNDTLTGSSDHPFVFSKSRFNAIQGLLSGTSFSGSVNSEARLGFQALDFLVERPFYAGKKLTASLGMGLRSQWISQKFELTSPLLIGVSSDESFENAYLKAHMTSWSLGPKFALNTNWLLGYGIKALGNLATSVLYTSYNSDYDTSFTMVGTGSASSHGSGLDNYGTLRPVTEAFLGLGWGSYFANQALHMDLLIGYDFNVFWDYNMIFATASQSVGNMYLHGMNIQLRFDF